jgi:uncharacterized protein
METAVVNDPDRERYVVTADGAEAGFAQYRERPALIAFTHTEVDPTYEGQGLGSTLIRAALDDARARGLSVLPFCPFVNAYISRHPDEYADLVPDAFRAKFDL